MSNEEFTHEELALGERMFTQQPDSPWTAFCELRELFGSMSLERRQALYDVVARRVEDRKILHFMLTNTTMSNREFAKHFNVPVERIHDILRRDLAEVLKG